MNQSAEPSNPPTRHWADLRFGDSYIALVAHSGYRSTAMDPGRYFVVLPRHASDHALAAAVRGCLGASRFLSLEEAQRFFVQARHPDAFEQWVGQMLQRTSMKSKTALFRSQRHILVTESNRQLRIVPSVRIRSGLFHGLLDKERVVAMDCDDGALITAVRAAMMDCK